MSEENGKSDLHTMLVAVFASVFVTAVTLSCFVAAFSTKSEVGVCEKYGWLLEGTGPYEHKHCVDPNTRMMYLPKEIAP